MLPSSETPLDFFKAELASDSTADKLKTLRRTSLISHLISPEQCREALLPSLLALIGSNQDEVLYALAEEVANLNDRIGNNWEYLALLLQPLETLAAHEETVVREKAIEGIVALLSRAEQLKKAEEFTKAHLIPTIENLAKGTWFPSRVSACGLIAPLYPHAQEGRVILRKIISSLATDDVPVVRRAAAAKMKEIVAVVERTTLEKVVIPLLISLSQDETQDSIRTSGLTALIELSTTHRGWDSTAKVLPTIQNTVADRSWRVRKTLAGNFDTLFSSYRDEIPSLLQTFQTLLQDPEQDIRVAALKSLSRVMGVLTVKQVKNTQLPNRFIALAEDTSPAVRAAVASVIGPFCEVVDRDVAQNVLLPLILELMNDEFHTVRFNMVCHAGEVCALMGVSSVANTIVSAVESLMSDAQWRVRLAVVNQIPHLAKQFGPGAFQTNLEPLYLKAFSDNVRSVRDCAIQNILKVGEVFGQVWTAKNLLPPILRMYREPPPPSQPINANAAEGGEPCGMEAQPAAAPTATTTSASSPDATAPPYGQSRGAGDGEERGVSYLTRMTVLHCVPVLVQVLPPYAVEKDIVNLVLTALKDPIPNVRFCAARIVGTLASDKHFPAAIINKAFSPVISRLAESDGDGDVRYFAREALQQIRQSAS